MTSSAYISKKSPEVLAQDYNTAHEWDIMAALRLAVAVLEDCNWHSLAQTLEEEADKNLKAKGIE
jgi:hypothetical protein